MILYFRRGVHTIGYKKHLLSKTQLQLLEQIVFTLSILTNIIAISR